MVQRNSVLIKRMVVLTGALAAALLFVWCGNKKDDNPAASVTVQKPLLSRLLPVDNIVQGWVKGYKGNCNSGLALTDSALYSIIDGGAEVYIKRDYRGSAYGGYSKDSGKICIEIYDQGSIDSARSLFNYIYASPDCDTLKALGDTARVDTFSWNMEMTKNKYFVRMYFYEKQLLPVVRLFAKAITDSVAANP